MTQQFYQQEGKSTIKKTLIGNPRPSYLEEADRDKPAFLGDSPIGQRKARTRNEKSNLSPESVFLQLLTQIENDSKDKEKSIKHQERAVLSASFDATTFRENVNFEKIQEATKVIRKKYANKKDLTKIYQTWNENSQGEISIDNIYNMSKKLGINLNYDEARVLLATANKNESETLGYTGFVNLLYGKDDKQTVDLNSLAGSLGNDYSVRREKAERERSKASNQEEAQKQAKEIKRANQVQLVFKNRVKDLKRVFEENDTNNTGLLNFEDFQEAVRKLRISDTVLCEQDIQEIYEKNKGENSKIEINSFLENLKNFNYDYQKADKELKSFQTPPKGPKIMDCRDLSFNQIENVHTKSRNVGKVIQKLFPTKADFTRYLEQTMNLSKDEVENLHVSKPQFNEIVDSLFNKFDVKYLTPGDFQGFLTSVLYNKNGYTNFNEITNTIYNEDIHKFTEKVQRKRHGPAPHNEQHSLRSKSEERVHTNTVRDSSEFEEARQGSLPPLKQSTTAGFKKLRFKDNLSHLLSDLDSKVFLSKKSALEAFRDFDIDNDGYVSHQDIITKIEGKNLIQSEDIPRLLEYIDPENKGYVDFKDFSSKIRPNMANRFNKEKSVVSFDKPDFEQERKSVSWVRKIIESTKKSLEATPTSKLPIFLILLNSHIGGSEVLKRVTRRGSNPPWKNTFLNFQSDSNTSMFISEKERFSKHPLASVSFQLEEKEKQRNLHEKKLENLRAKQDAFRAKLDHESSRLEQKDQEMLKLKYFRLTTYERVTFFV